VDDKMMDAVAASAKLGISASMLNKLRIVGGGPVYVKIGARVCYAESDLNKYITQQKRLSTAQNGRAS
jgi:ribulose 1,5-bisphosphate carboxylase large subunit-like protein